MHNSRALLPGRTSAANDDPSPRDPQRSMPSIARELARGVDAVRLSPAEILHGAFCAVGSIRSPKEPVQGYVTGKVAYSDNLTLRVYTGGLAITAAQST